MQKYEFKVIEDSPFGLERKLNALGEEGYSVVGVSDKVGYFGTGELTSKATIILQRLKQSE